MRKTIWGALFGSLALGTLVVAPAVLAQSDDEEKPYNVINGTVDKSVYNGYRRYHASCHVCHGPDGLGSSYAPSLVDSLTAITYDDFFEVVVNGRENLIGSTPSVMPAFGYVDDVMLYLDDIYGYLKARSDGVLERGRPKRHDR